MPSVSKRICNKCKKIVPANHRCIDKTYAKTYNKYKRNHVEFYNSSAWRKKSKYIMSRDYGLCQNCLRLGITNKCNLVDHIIELNDNYELRLDDSNLESLCHNCHNKKTIATRIERKNNK